MKKVVLWGLGAVVVLSVVFYSHGGKEVLTVLVGLALPAVPSWVIWQIVKLLKGPSVPVSPEEEKRLREINKDIDFNPAFRFLGSNVFHHPFED